MFRILIILFILVPIVEIAVFIQVGDLIGLSSTIIIVIVTAILGVNLLKQQGFRAWQEIQLSIAKGNMPALEMAAAAQLLFAGGLLLTPGFVTDLIGFLLMIPQLRLALASHLIKSGTMRSQQFHSQTFHANYSNEHSKSTENSESTEQLSGRIIEGEFEDEEQKK